MHCAKITSAQDLREHYWLLEEACERLTAREGRLHFAPDVYAALMRGDALMTLVIDAGEAAGLFTTYKRSATPDDGSLHVWHAYVRPGAHRQTLQIGLDECELQAQEQGCNSLVFSTQRPGWLRLAPELGYELVSYKFRKEVRT
jgi:hypothetical protein